MKTITINLPYKRKETDREKIPDRELTQNLIEYGSTSAHPDGLTGKERRQFGRIQRKIDEAMDSSADSIELEDGDYDFLVETLRKAKFPATWSGVVVTLEDELERAGRAEEAEAK